MRETTHINIKRMLASGTILLCGVLVVTTVAAQTTQPGAVAGQGGERRGGAMLQRVRDLVGELQLSDAQKTKIDQIFDDAQKEVGPMMQELRQLDPQERGQRMREFLG